LLARSGWKDHVVMLPPGAWNDVLTGAQHVSDDGSVPCEALLAERPVALLVSAS
jgi:(1->4)-alpha-D-glucan 1-alpha-D-glucosylmutase